MNLYQLNGKLVRNIKSLRKKIIEIKEKYNKRIRKAQKFGINALEMTLPRFDTELTDEERNDGDILRAIEGYNSNDSYDQERPPSKVRAYRDAYGSKMQITENDEGHPLNTAPDYAYEENAYYDLESKLDFDQVSYFIRKIDIFILLLMLSK
jgi:seryl-tRNA(Sec) selenium transferase